MRSLFGVLLIAVAAVAVATPAAGAAPRKAAVAGVVDGDTIRVDLGRRTVAVDLIGVSAATGCGVDGAATLRALLPRGAKVRLVRDAYRRGAYVFRGATFVNAELIELGVAKAGRLRGLRRARALRSAERVARGLELGVWSCPETATGPAVPAAGDGADLAEIDRYVRGFRFTVTEEGGSGAEAYKMEMVANFCADGRVIVRMRMTGVTGAQDGGSARGTWKLLGVRRDDRAFLGRLEVQYPEEGEESGPEQIFVGHRADGTPVIGDGDEQMTATRAPADAC